MLIVSRRVGETIEIRPREGAEAVTLEQAFAHGPIRIHFVRMSPSRVQIAVDAPPELEIRRGRGEACPFAQRSRDDEHGGEAADPAATRGRGP